MKNKSSFLTVANEVLNQLAPLGMTIVDNRITIDSVLDFDTERDLYVFWYFAETLGYTISFKEEKITLPTEGAALLVARKRIMEEFCKVADVREVQKDRELHFKWFER